MTSILLADDHPAICFALQVLLEKNSRYSVTSSSGENLIAQLHRSCPDLLVLDLDLKHADGLDLLSRIKHHFPAIKVLVYTNQPAHIYAQRTLLACAQGYVNKSIPLSMMESVFHLLLEGYQFFPEGTYAAMGAQVNIDTDDIDITAQFSDREIADILMLSNKTISTYKARMMKKTGVEEIDELFHLLDTGNKK